MNDQQKLTQPGQLRKAAMLNELQEELRALQARKQFRKTSIALASTFGFILAMAFVSNWSKTVNVDALGNSHLHSSTAYAHIIAPNRPSVIKQYVDARETSQLSFATMSDTELLNALESIGQSMVLGEIDGQQVLIRNSLSP